MDNTMTIRTQLRTPLVSSTRKAVVGLAAGIRILPSLPAATRSANDFGVAEVTGRGVLEPHLLGTGN